MVNERVIFCCGASRWTKGFQIVRNGIALIVSISELIGSGNTALVIALPISFLALIMGIILLKGTKERRIGFLKAWLFFGVITGFAKLVTLFSNTSGSLSDTFVVSGLFAIVINVFSVAVVYIHMKEITEGVFMP